MRERKIHLRRTWKHYYGVETAPACQPTMFLPAGEDTYKYTTHKDEVTCGHCRKLIRPKGVKCTKS